VCILEVPRIRRRLWSGRCSATSRIGAMADSMIQEGAREPALPSSTHAWCRSLAVQKTQFRLGTTCNWPGGNTLTVTQRCFYPVNRRVTMRHGIFNAASGSVLVHPHQQTSRHTLIKPRVPRSLPIHRPSTTDSTLRPHNHMESGRHSQSANRTEDSPSEDGSTLIKGVSCEWSARLKRR
jgi:hypothetical protein